MSLGSNSALQRFKAFQADRVAVNCADAGIVRWSKLRCLKKRSKSLKSSVNTVKFSWGRVLPLFGGVPHAYIYICIYTYIYIYIHTHINISMYMNIHVSSFLETSKQAP